MRPCYLLLAFLVIAFPVRSESDVNAQINKACQRHAVSLVARLKSEITGDLGSEQTSRALAIATESCEAYFTREFGTQQSIATTTGDTKKEKVTAKEGAEKAEEEDDDGYSFFDNVELKDGHERLRKRR